MTNSFMTKNECDLAWLAGIWDGEGTFQLNQIETVRNGNLRKHYYVSASVEMTTRLTIDKIADILDANGIKYNRHVCKKKNIKHKTAYRITVQKQTEIIVLVCQIYPYLVTKSDLAAALALYCFSRIRNITPRTGGRFSGCSYTEFEDLLYKDIKTLNFRGINAEIE